MNILYLAPGNSIHSKKWIEKIKSLHPKNNYFWYSFEKFEYEIDKEIIIFSNSVNKKFRLYAIINFILHFHNIVNKRLNKKKFSLEQHNKLYHRAKTANIVGHFSYVMSKNANNSKAMLDTFNRKRIVNDFLKYLNTHHYMFYP